MAVINSKRSGQEIRPLIDFAFLVNRAVLLSKHEAQVETRAQWNEEMKMQAIGERRSISLYEVSGSDYYSKCQPIVYSRRLVHQCYYSPASRCFSLYYAESPLNIEQIKEKVAAVLENPCDFLVNPDSKKLPGISGSVLRSNWKKNKCDTDHPVSGGFVNLIHYTDPAAVGLIHKVRVPSVQ